MPSSSIVFPMILVRIPWWHPGQYVKRASVRLAVCEHAATPFYGEMGGIVPTPHAILREVKKHAG